MFEDFALACALWIMSPIAFVEVVIWHLKGCPEGEFPWTMQQLTGRNANGEYDHYPKEEEE